MAMHPSMPGPDDRQPDDVASPSDRSGEMAGLEDSDPIKRTGEFLPAVLDRTVIAVPLLRELREEVEARAENPSLAPRIFPVIIDINNEFRGKNPRERIAQLVDQAITARGRGSDQGIKHAKSALSDQYVFARLEGDVIRELVRLDNEGRPEISGEHASARTGHRAIHSVWPDFAVQPLLTKSHVTVKADAARAAFSALGEGIAWAVVDSGIDEQHPHFQRYGNLKLGSNLTDAHKDFTDSAGGALCDEFGHGTHVAGILAGEMTAPEEPPAEQTAGKDPEIVAYARHRDEMGQVVQVKMALNKVSGMAPKCQLVSLKVLDDEGKGEASSLIVALEHVQRINNYGRRILIHGVNMSLGYGYEPEWFGCGQSPLCVEVDRLVRSGVVVVVAAGNTGFGWLQAHFKPNQPVASALDLSINDPGNAELAITVGSTHRESPHLYGVSYFSSKGPTGDGRLKPDLVAPGEKIISCAAGKKLTRTGEARGRSVYVEDSGTSMAAPHVSGVIAAFLSIRREFVGRPERVKEIFLSTATDLRRDRNFQGHGLVDLMRAIQSV